MADRTTIQVNPQRAVPSAGASSNNIPAPARSNDKNELVIAPIYAGLQQPVVEDSYYYFAQTGTRNTGVNLTNGTGTSYSATQAILVVDNTAGAGGADIVLDYFQIKIDTAITAGTFWYLYGALDNKNRYSSGGVAMTGHNHSLGVPATVGAYSGVVVTTAASGSVQDIFTDIILNGVGVANMLITIKFGGEAGSQTFTDPTTGVTHTTYNAPPVAIPPGGSFVLNEFQTSRSATGVGEFFLGAIVR